MPGWVIPIFGVACTLIGACLPSFVSWFNSSLNRKSVRKEKNEKFARIFLDKYNPMIHLMIEKLKEMDYKDNEFIDFNRNNLLFGYIKDFFKMANDVYYEPLIKIYPLEIRDDFSKLFTVMGDIFFCTSVLAMKESYDTFSKRYSFQKRVEDSIEFSEETMEKLEKEISKKYI